MYTGAHVNDKIANGMQGNGYYEVKTQLLRENRGLALGLGKVQGILFITIHPTRRLCRAIFWVCVFKCYDKKLFKWSISVKSTI